MIRSNGVKVITVFIGQETDDCYMEQREVVTDVGELAGLRVDRADQLIDDDETDRLQRAANVPEPMMGQSVAVPLETVCMQSCRPADPCQQRTL